MEKINGIVIIYIISLILIMGGALGIWLVSPFSGSKVFGIAWIIHTLFMLWAILDDVGEAKE